MTRDLIPADDAPLIQQARMGGGRPQAIILQTMDDAFRLGKAICLAGMAPKGMDTPEKCMIAIMRGMEVGLTPMQALDKIAIVNGRPTIWGDGALGLVRGSGVCNWVRETLDGVDDAMTATCETQRRGEPESIKRTFSVADAKKAGLWGKAGPWQQFPTRMLAMRARAFCLRDGFADVLGGLYLKEELEGGEDRQEPASPPSRAPSPGPAPQVEHKPAEPAPEAARQPSPARAETPRQAPSPSAAPAQQAKPAEASQRPAQEQQHGVAHYDPERTRKLFAAAAAAATDAEALALAWEDHVSPFLDDPMLAKGTPDYRDLDGIYLARQRQIGDGSP